jgi:hypothetical protein
MTEVPQIQPQEDNSLEISMMLSDIAAIGDLLTASASSDQELMPDTVSDLGFFMQRHVARIRELYLGEAK